MQGFINGNLIDSFISNAVLNRKFALHIIMGNFFTALCSHKELVLVIERKRLLPIYGIIAFCYHPEHRAARILPLKISPVEESKIMQGVVSSYNVS